MSQHYFYLLHSVPRSAFCSTCCPLTPDGHSATSRETWNLAGIKAYPPGSNTKNLMKHAEDHHGVRFDKEKGMVLLPYDASTQQLLTQAMVKGLQIMQLLPFSLYEADGAARSFELCLPRWKLPDHKQVAHVIESANQEQIKAARELLVQLRGSSHVCV